MSNPAVLRPRGLRGAAKAVAGWAACCLLLLASSRSEAASPHEASNSRAAMSDAIASMPLDQLTEGTRNKVRQVLAKPSIYRRTPTQVVPCDPQLHLFLVRYPEIVVNIWELMGVTKLTVQRTGPYTFHAEDGAGTASDVELVYGTRNMHLYYAEANYSGSLAPRPVKAKCVMLLRSGGSQQEEGRDYMANRLDIFIRVENLGADLLVRTLHPIVERAADVNFNESVNFLSRVSQTAEKNGTGMQRLVTRLNRVDPVIRRRFAELSADVSRRAASREFAADPPRLEEPPVASSAPSTLSAASTDARPLRRVAPEPPSVDPQPDYTVHQVEQTSDPVTFLPAPPRLPRQASLEQIDSRPLPRKRATVILRR